jgi:phage-related protein
MYFEPVIPPVLPPFDPVSIVLDIIGFVLRIFGVGQPDLSGLAYAINSTWSNFVVGISFIYNYIRQLVIMLIAAVTAIFKAFTHIISDILHGHLLNVLKDIQGLFHTLQQIFKPILDAINWLRKQYYLYVYKWVKLAQNILSVVRVFLSALKTLGVQWAAKLDADIARIQGFITKWTTLVVSTLNQLSTWLGIALDPIGIIRTGFMRDSIFNSVASISRALNVGKNRYLTASEAANTQGDRAMMGGGAAILTRNQDGSVNYSDASKRINSGYDAAWATYGGTTGLP